MLRFAILQEAADAINQHLMVAAPSEDGAFCLLWEGKGQRGRRLIASRPFLPGPNAWERQGPDMLRPTAQLVSAAVSRAIEARSGLLFVHSHPDPYHPPGLSGADYSAFETLARTLAPMLDGPFAAAVIHPSGWSSVVWTDAGPIEVEQIVSVGRTIRFLTRLPVPAPSDLDVRQRDALGVVNDRLRALAVAVVGSGGIGSPIAEQLVRVGVREVTLIDADLLDTPSNVRRMFCTKVSDLRQENPPAKVDVIGSFLDGLEFGVPIRAIRGDVRYEHVFRELLDADVVLLATDTHSSRATVNELAYSYLLPVIDAGVRVGSKTNGNVAGLLAEVRVLTPVTPCLWCRRTLDPETIRVENLFAEDRDRQRREGYIVNNGADAPVPTVTPLTVLASGMSMCALLALLSEEGEVCPSGYWFDGMLGDSRVIGPDQPLANCRCRTRLGLGDSGALPFLRPSARPGEKSSRERIQYRS